MRLSTFAAGAFVLCAPALAAGEARPLKAPGTADYGDIVAGPPTVHDLRMARQVLPPITNPITPGGSVALAVSKTIYLNKNGVTLQPGNNDSRTNRSTLANQAVTLPAWNASPAVWTATVNCMKDMFAAYEVIVTDVDPGATPHIEAVFGGSPGQLGMPNGVAGVSPFTQNCAIIENAIVFTFTAVLPQTDSRLMCEIMAQEVAHAYGLDHELLASDPMTYLDYNGNRSFQNQTASCGEDVQRPCGINGSVCRPNQNSVTLLTERLGKKVGGGGTDTIPPTGSITSPLPNTQVPPGFLVYTDANDNQMVVNAKLYIDGQVSLELTSGPFNFATPATLSEGQHRLKVDIYDGTATYTTQEITVTVKKGAPDPGDGGGSGNGNGGGYEGEITGGCSATSSGAGIVFVVSLIAGLRRRRMRA
ncbi:MAG: Ig-like domain-containing protein [Kofleriaceae bacterium]